MRRRRLVVHVVGVPCFTLRDNTERPVTITHGTNTILGLDPVRLTDIPALLTSPRLHLTPPLWDGEAGIRAAAAIEEFLGLARLEVEPLAATAD